MPLLYSIQLKALETGIILLTNADVKICRTFMCFEKKSLIKQQYSWNGFLNRYTVFPHIVSLKTILFLNLEICTKVTVHKGAETVQGWKLYEEIQYAANFFFTISSQFLSQN